MEAEVILLVVTILYLLLATISDIKTREVPDWLSYAFIAFALFVKAVHAILFNDPKFFFFGLLGLGIAFLIANLMYYTKQWGGGDAKVLMGLGVVFISYPSFLVKYFSPSITVSFFFTFILNLFIIGAFYGILYAFLLAILNREKTKKALKFILEKKSVKKTRNTMFVIICLFLVLSFIFLEDNFSRLFLILIAFFLLVLFYLTIFIRAVEKATLYKTIPVMKLTEGDWIINPIFLKKKLIYSPKSIGVTKQQILLIKKLRIKNVLVKEGIPFIPSFLIATIISLIFGNIIFI